MWSRLTSYSGTDLLASSACDRDGNKASQTVNPSPRSPVPAALAQAGQAAVTTYYYIGGLYEVTGTSVRKYYAIAGQSIVTCAR
jgi:hypothetical protein